MPQDTARVAPAALPTGSLVVRMAQRYGADPQKFLSTVKATAFRQRPDKDGNIREPSNEELFALLAIADRYQLDVFTRELFAYLDPKSGAIIPVVSVDGWVRIINAQESLRGIEFVYSPETKTHKGKTVHEWIECVITRSDRDTPLRIREYFDEVVRTVSFATPWDTHPNRMHRHKALIQCSRVAFGFAGIYDADEAARILEAGATPAASEQAPAVAAINAKVAPHPTSARAPALEHAPAQGIPTTIDATPERVAAEAPEPVADHAGKAAAVAPTFAEVATALNAAKDAEALALARDLIRHVADPAHRADLESLAGLRAGEVGGAA